MKRGQNSFKGGCSSRLSWLFCQVLGMLGHGDHRYPPIKEEYLNRLIPINSERSKALGFPYVVLETPGHTGDHIALQAGDLLFCGDTAKNGFPSRRRIIIWIEDLKQYWESWKRIMEAKPKMLYPGHGKPYQMSDLELLNLEGIRLYPPRHKE